MNWTVESVDTPGIKCIGAIVHKDSAASVMKDPKDILLIDLDDQGKWKIITKDQIDKTVKSH